MQIPTKHLVATIAIALTISCEQAHAVVQGIDVSHFQGNINWTSVKNDGIGFVFMKATEGVDFVDSKFTTYMPGALAANLLAGPYHFARPDSFNTNPLDAANEANDFVDAIQPYYQSSTNMLRPVIDLERTSRQINDEAALAAEKIFLSQWIRNFAAVVQTRLSLSPIIYTSSGFATYVLEDDLNQYPLWIADPSSTNNFAAAAPPFQSDLGIWGNSGYTFWQWSWTGNVSGINPVDRDVFDGTLQELRQYSNSPVVPEPATGVFALIAAALCGASLRGRRR